VIWLLRHTRVAVPAGICYGRSDVALADSAPAEIAATAALLPPLTDALVISSPARRCTALAAAISPGFTTDARLLELDFGAWEGMAWDDVPREALDAWAANPWGFAAPGGESGHGLLARVQEFWAARPDRPLVIISHGGPLRLLRQLAEGRAPDILEPPPALGAAVRIGYSVAG